jgi:hypothetical protein
MSTHVEDGVKLAGTRHNVGEAQGVLPQRLLAVQELDRGVILLEGLDGCLVDWSFTTLGRRNGDFDTLVVENLPGVGEFGLDMDLISNCDFLDGTVAI